MQAIHIGGVGWKGLEWNGKGSDRVRVDMFARAEL